MDLPFLKTGADEGSEFGYRLLQTLPVQIAEQVNRAIMRGDYGPGDPIKEQALADSFHVSRGPVREALRILEKDGVVRLIPNRGARVTQLTTREVNDIFEIRESLSQLAVKYLCSTENDDLRRKFIEGADRISGLADNPDLLTDYVNLSYALSTLLSTAPSNERLAEMMQSLARQTIRYTLLGLRRPERRKESAAIWHRVAQAVRDRDVQESRNLIAQLISDSRKAAVAELEQEHAKTPPLP